MSNLQNRSFEPELAVLTTRAGTIKNAPNGKYRIIGFDTFDYSDFIIDDVSSLDVAKQISDSKTDKNSMFEVAVYDSNGKHLYG